MSHRHIVVQLKSGPKYGPVIKLCDSWDDYQHWLENHANYDERNLKTMSASVYEA